MQQFTSEMNIMLAVSDYTLLLIGLSVCGVVLLLLLLAFLLFAFAECAVFIAKDAFQNNPAKRKKLLAVCYALLACCIICPLGMVWNFRKTQALSAAASVSISEETNIYAQLNDATWKTLTEAERLALLQAAADAEAKLLGISRSITLYAQEIETAADAEAFVAGYLYSGSGNIVINSDILASGAAFSGYDCLKTVLHEVYHVYQQELITLYYTLDDDARSLVIFETVRCYIDEFSEGYVAYAQDYDGYASQQLEVDACDYSIAQTAMYWQNNQG